MGYNRFTLIHPTSTTASVNMLTDFRARLIVFLSLFTPVIYAQTDLYINPLKPPAADVIEEGRHIVDKMRKAERGPYKRLRWFCADGSAHEPRPYACGERGGGKQHAEYSEDWQRLSELGWHVGGIYSAHDLKYWTNSSNRYARLRELPVEKYLSDIDDGWVLQRAKYYRGRVQAEDEERSGQQILLQLLSTPGWLTNNYLLARELVRIIPHGAGVDLNRSIRRIALEIAEADRNFELLRIEIHTAPSASTAERVQQWLNKNADSSQKEKTQKLLAQLNQLYGAGGRQARLQSLRSLTATLSQLESTQALLVEAKNEIGIARIERLGQLLANIRELVADELKPRQRLQLLDALTDIEAELKIASGLVLAEQNLTRHETLTVLRGLVLAGYGSGLLSAGEQTEIIRLINKNTAATSVSFRDYQQLSVSLNLTAIWAIGSIRYTFAESLNRYTALDERAVGFTDDLLRSSPMLQLADISRTIAQDVQHIANVHKSIGGQAATSMLALNPGIAIGPLRILSEEDLHRQVALNREEIVVLPQTVSELSPVSGILTLGEGNLLSHVQLLARNFGIPNISITQELYGKISALEGKKVILVAASDGSVMLEEFARLSAELQKTLAPAKEHETEKLEVPLPDLSVKRPLPIKELKKELSGLLVGPKAANLGELNRLFPAKVAPAIALPFGFFLENVNQFAATNWNQLRSIYRQHRDGEMSDEQLSEALTTLRMALGSIKLDAQSQNELTAMMRELFGEDGQYGLFLRSDTNVEDLPGFTGAGLSETIPNVVGLQRQIQTIPVIWASVLAPRAIAWRSNLLKQPENVYPSVLLMKSVNSSKSGVLITADLLNRETGITASTAWGVGGAVAGEATESLVLLEDGSEVLISEAKTPFQRSLSKTGGVEWIPSADGPVLSASEKQQLRVLSKEVHIKYPPLRDKNGKALPWDIEFGFVDEKLTLFQIRALVERGQEKANQLIRKMFPATKVVSETVDLNDQMLTTTGTN